MAANVLFIFLALLTIQSVNSGKESHLFSSASALVICTASLRGLSMFLAAGRVSCSPHSKFAILAKSLRPKEVSSRSKASYFALILGGNTLIVVRGETFSQSETEQGSDEAKRILKYSISFFNSSLYRQIFRSIS